MRGHFASVLVSLSTSALVGGLFAYHFGYVLSTPLSVHGLGIFDGVWNPADYSFMGAVLASLGAGGLAGLFLPPGRSSVRNSVKQVASLSEESVSDLHDRLDQLQQKMQEVQTISYDYHLSCDAAVAQIQERITELEAGQRPASSYRRSEERAEPVRIVVR